MTLAPLHDRHPAVAVPAPTLGLATLMRLVQVEAELNIVWQGLLARNAADENDAGALLDISTLLQMSGQPDKGLELQAVAIAQQPCYRTIHGAGGGLRILAFLAPGDLMANTPLDFLLEGSNAELILYYLDGPPPPADQLPPHDVAFLAVSQSDKNAALLADLAGVFDHWPRPVLNGRPDLIASLSREWVPTRFANEPTILAPPTLRVSREAFVNLALRLQHGDDGGGLTFPLIARPVDSHAGRGLAKLDDAASVAGYLAAQGQEEFYVAPFVDYSGPDGLYRKLRLVFVHGRPFIAHMAISQHWMVHYLNADMDQSDAKRGEEAAMMASFDEGFAARHAAAFAALCAKLPLDYFGVDCAETQDGRLLLFESDVAMIVHTLDPPDLYPYKRPAMTKLFAAFLSACDARARGG